MLEDTVLDLAATLGSTRAKARVRAKRVVVGLQSWKRSLYASHKRMELTAQSTFPARCGKQSTEPATDLLVVGTTRR